MARSANAATVSRSKITEQRLTTGKVILGLGIAVTSAIPLFFVQYDEPEVLLTVYKFLAKVGSLVGAMFLIWQYFLGFRGTISALLPDLSWVVELHKKLGQYGMLVIPLHPIFIGLYYFRHYELNIYDLDLQTDFSRWVLLGMILLGIIAFIVITSAFFRQSMGFYRWFYTHLSTYLVPPLLFAHGLLLGPTIQGTAFGSLWWSFIILMGAFYLYRIAHKLGVFARRYRVRRTSEAASRTTELLMEPVKNGLRPKLGQFVYLRGRLAENSHPYTVSTYDEESELLGITAKEEGSQTARLQETRVGDELILDGPYGAFTRVALSRDCPIVMIAGGIGITPFRRLWRILEEERDREAWLFYGNEFYDDIVFREEIDSLEHVRVVHVLNQEPDFHGDKGFITVDVLRKHLSRDLSQHQFLICGPPVMIVKLEAELKNAGVPDELVRHELFAT